MKEMRDTDPSAPETPPPDAWTSRTGRLTAYLAALAAVAGIPVHLYWALSGTWGFPGGTTTVGLPGLRAVNLVVSALLACGAVYLYALTRPWARRPPALLVLAPVWAAAVVCVSHGLFGITTKGLYLSGVKSAVSWPETALTAGQKISPRCTTSPSSSRRSSSWDSCSRSPAARSPGRPPTAGDAVAGRRRRARRRVWRRRGRDPSSLRGRLTF